jgi:hypothetical protein
MTATLALISGLPREDLQNLTKEIATLIQAAPKDKVKRVAAVGQKAWFAFMRHCRDTMADRFTAGLKAPEIAVICKEIRADDEAAYTAFVEKFKAENPAPTSEAPAPVPAEPVAKPVAAPSASKAKSAEKEQNALAKSAEKEQKAAAKSAEKEQKAAEKAAEKEQKAAEKEAAKAAKAAEKAADKLQRALEKQQKLADKEAEKAAAKAAKQAAKPSKAKPAAKKATATAPMSAEATPAPAEPEEDVMPKITIGGVTYFHDESSNGLYGIDAATNGLSHWVGFFQPDNEAEPIRYTASEGDDE